MPYYPKGSYGRGHDRRDYQERSSVDVSSLFGGNPDVTGIKKAFESRSLQRNAIEPYFKKIVEDAKNFHGWNSENMLANAITVAAYLRSQNLKTNQVRRILEMARTVELKVKKGDNIKKDIMKIRYLLAYTVGKASGQSRYPIEAFHNILDPMLEVIMKDPTPENFGKFYDFLQAVVAYHKFFGGGD
ncbi:type III-A CRISPR-associated protein Csm2 [Thermococcus sp.]